MRHEWADEMGRHAVVEEVDGAIRVFTDWGSADGILVQCHPDCVAGWNEILRLAQAVAAERERCLALVTEMRERLLRVWEPGPMPRRVAEHYLGMIAAAIVHEGSTSPSTTSSED